MPARPSARSGRPAPRSARHPRDRAPCRRGCGHSRSRPCEAHRRRGRAGPGLPAQVSWRGLGGRPAFLLRPWSGSCCELYAGRSLKATKAGSGGMTMKVGLAGFGNVGRDLAKRLSTGVIPGMQLVAVSARDLVKAEQAARAIAPPPSVVPLAELPALCDVVVECATA